VIVVVAQFLRHPDKDFAPKAAASSTVKAISKSRKGTENFSTPEMLATPMFWILFVTFTAMGIGGLFLTASSGSLAKDWKYTAAMLATAQSAGLIANASSRPFWGWISDKWGRENTMAVAFFLQALALMSVAAFGVVSYSMFALTIVFTYFTWGEIYSLF